MPEPLVTCIVPVYNGERYLQETLEALAAQTYSPVEILVVNDGSTDGTRALIEAWGDRVRCVHQDHAGPGAARNTGIDATGGAFVAFQDADDIPVPGRLARQMRAFAEQPDLDICLAHMQNFWMPELAAERERLEGHLLTRPTRTTVTQAGLVRRSLLDAVRFDPSLTTGEDQDWMLRAMDHGASVSVLPDILIQRRFHHGNLTRIHRRDIGQHMTQVVKKSLDRRRRVPPPD